LFLKDLLIKKPLIKKKIGTPGKYEKKLFKVFIISLLMAK
jgi:hypothetical protein